VAQRVLKRQSGRPEVAKPDYRGDTETREKLRSSLFSNDGQEILICIVEQAKYWKSETFTRVERAPEQRLFAIEHIAIYRDLIEKIFAKADLPIPDTLKEALN
jgi:hypothetical protein